MADRRVGQTGVVLLLSLGDRRRTRGGRGAGGRVVVLNHFAVPRGCPGGTRHVELFDKLIGWRTTIVAARSAEIRSAARATRTGEPFVFVPVTPYKTNGPARVLNWITYFLSATAVALTRPKPDIIYASSPHLLAGVAGAIVAKVRRARFILEVRDLWPQVLVDMGQLSESSVTYRALRWLERLLYARAEAIVVLAAGSRTAVSDLAGAEKPVIHIPNAADPADFRPSAGRAELRKRFGFDRLTAVYVGAHGPANGLHLLVKAAAALRAEEMSVVLVGDGVEKESLRRLAAQLGVADVVRFLDPVPKDAVPDVLAAADIGIHCLADVPLFRYAVSPNKIYDYMGAGLPIVTNTPGEVARIVTEAGAGVAVDFPELATGIRELAARPAREREAIGQRGRSWLLSGNSRANAAETLQRLLDRQLVQQKGCVE